MKFARKLVAPARIQGIGLHSGLPAAVELYPAPDGAGISFEFEGQITSCGPEALYEARNNTTRIRCGVRHIETVEHLLAALYGYGVLDCRIKLSGQPEVPILDGSALEWLQILKQRTALVPAAADSAYCAVQQVEYVDSDSVYRFTPASDRTLRISCSISFSNSVIGSQAVTYTASPFAFETEIAFARTFLKQALNDFDTKLPDSELARLRGLRGCDMRNGPVILHTPSRYISELRSQDEPVRHKILDLLGDLAFLGQPLCGVLDVQKPSHHANLGFVRALYRERYRSQTPFTEAANVLEAARS